MTNLLESLVTYLAPKVGLVAGTSAFYHEMPTMPTKCLLLQEEQTNTAVLAQIDGEVHRVRITVREGSNSLAHTLARLCWRWLLTDDAQFDIDKRTDTTGIITVLDGLRSIPIQVKLFGNPVWEKADQQGRKYYCFYAVIITPR